MIYHIDTPISATYSICDAVQLVHVYESKAGELLDIDITLAVNKNSMLEFSPIIMGHGSYRMSFTFILEDHAQALIKGAYSLVHDQQCHITTRQYHVGKDSVSNLAINGIAKECAVSDYRGMIRIEKMATGTQAHQENKTMLLGSQARATSIPSIEVLNHDVSCAHGSAIGPLDVEHIRYCQARGIAEATAKKMMVRSFFATMLDTIKQAEDKQRLVDSLTNRMIE